MLKLTNVEKKYDQFALRCTMEVKPGFVTGLIGKNGAGKSTTFKSILNLIQIDSGEIVLLGKNHDTLSTKDKEHLGIVLSDSGFSEYLSINDVILIMKAMYTKFNKDVFIQKCKAFDLPLNKKIKEFSTGMKAKLKVICAMSHQADLLILDEPTVGLDVIARDELLDLLRLYMEENENSSILISSHISSDLEGLCDEIYMIDNGNIVLHEETDVLLSEYAVLKLDEKQFETIDKKYIIKKRKERYGYACLTNQKQFYLENYPEVVIEKGNIDDVITLMVRGE